MRLPPSHDTPQPQRDREVLLKNWNEAPLSEVMDYIVQSHHAYCRRAIATIEPLLAELLRPQEEAHHELKRIQTLFAKFSTELRRHLVKEEDTPFPCIAKMEEAVRRQQAFSRPSYGTVAHPVRMMMMEHDGAREDFRQIRQASRNYECPPDASPALKTLYQALRELEQDLQVHSDLEDKVLFPRAIALEIAAGSSAKEGSFSSR